MKVLVTVQGTPCWGMGILMGESQPPWPAAMLPPLPPALPVRNQQLWCHSRAALTLSQCEHEEVSFLPVDAALACGNACASGVCPWCGGCPRLVGCVHNVGGVHGLWGVSTMWGVSTACGVCPRSGGCPRLVGCVHGVGGVHGLWGVSTVWGVSTACGVCPRCGGCPRLVGCVHDVGGVHGLWGVSTVWGVSTACGVCPQKPKAARRLRLALSVTFQKTERWPAVTWCQAVFPIIRLAQESGCLQCLTAQQ